MATSPQFAGTVLNGSAVLSATADNSYVSPAHAVTVVTGGASGSKIDEVRFQANGTTVAGNVTLFIYNGTTYFLVDAINVPVVTPGSGSTGIAPWQLIKAYANLTLLSSSWTLCASSTVASQLICVSAFGGSF